MPVIIGTRVPSSSLRSAAIGLGLSPGTSKSGILRAALALFHSLDPYAYIDPPAPVSRSGVRSASKDVIDVAGQAPDELALMPVHQATGKTWERSTAIRVGLAMAAGWSREESEEWARGLARKAGPGRPRKALQPPTST